MDADRKDSCIVIWRDGWENRDYPNEIKLKSIIVLQLTQYE